MNYKLLFATIRHLKIAQIFYQLKYRLVSVKYKNYKISNWNFCRIKQCIDRNCSFSNNKFSFLNITDHFHSWNDTTHGMLWAYNLNYMDYLNQASITYEEGEKWINQFIEELPNNKIGLDPYPIALRGINWIKFISRNQDRIDSDTQKRWNNSLYSQYVLLTKKLEYHLLGNHLLEDAYSLFIASVYFQDEKFYSISTGLLRKELKEQILADGAHYEQSPMYHCILLDRLLDCYNVSINNSCFKGQCEVDDLLKNTAERMLGHLESIVLRNHRIPLLNDAAYGIAPSPETIYEYASSLGLQWTPIPLGECGYRKLADSAVEAIVDVGNIESSYQPGHTHADVFNYELYIDNEPVVMDTGISTYNKTARRQYERGISAHNTVGLDGRDMHEVWGGFRVGNRAKVTILKEEKHRIEARHDGYGKRHLHRRTFVLAGNEFGITDEIAHHSTATSYIHLSPDVEIIRSSENEIITNKCKITIEGAQRIAIDKDFASVEYNRMLPIHVVKIHFKSYLHYKITK